MMLETFLDKLQQPDRLRHPILDPSHHCMHIFSSSLLACTYMYPPSIPVHLCTLDACRCSLLGNTISGPGWLMLSLLLFDGNNYYRNLRAQTSKAQEHSLFFSVYSRPSLLSPISRTCLITSPADSRPTSKEGNSPSNACFRR